MTGKRTFYADDEDVVTKPGYNSQISNKLKEEESSHGNISFIQGMGIRSIPVLEKYANQARLFLFDKLQLYSAELDTQKSAFNNELATINSTFHSIITEPILPSFIYILTASLTGSILVNKRSLPLRFITPLAFGGAAFNYYMPQSFANTKSKICQFERENFPQLYKQQIELNEQVQVHGTNISKSLKSAEIELQRNIYAARKTLADLYSDEGKN